MKRQEFIKRWDSQEFIEIIKEDLEAVFIRFECSKRYDLRGITIGSMSQLKFLETLNLRNSRLSEIDLSYSKIQTTFSEGTYSNLSFDHAGLEQCLILKAMFINCSFVFTKIRANMDGSYFEDCDFNSSTFLGKGIHEFGGRRTTFNSCNFKDALFKKVEFRASKFFSCNFEGATFEKCDLRGVKFENMLPKKEQMIECMI